MRRKRFFRGTTGIYDPNLTPLIDVCLVLVVILLVATPMTLQSGIAVSRAAKGGKSGAEVRASRIEITIRDDQNLTVGQERCCVVCAGRRHCSSGDPAIYGWVIQLRCRKRTPYG